MCRCGTVCPAGGPSLMPMLKSVGPELGLRRCFGLVKQRHERGALLVANLKEGGNVAPGITRLWPGDTGKPSRIQIAC